MCRSCVWTDSGPVDDDLSSGGEDQAAADNPAHAALQQKLQQKEKQAAKKPKATPKQSKAMVHTLMGSLTQCCSYSCLATLLAQDLPRMLGFNSQLLTTHHAH